mmetsp:Transcript_54422/g.167532  ORF Transcript_54422/g.167532 Transcript_54422/m.167532 type:complete len:472 (+) Transcript_54422:521-1936(+)
MRVLGRQRRADSAISEAARGNAVRGASNGPCDEERATGAAAVRRGHHVTAALGGFQRVPQLRGGALVEAVPHWSAQREARERRAVGRPTPRRRGSGGAIDVRGGGRADAGGGKASGVVEDVDAEPPRVDDDGGRGPNERVREHGVDLGPRARAAFEAAEPRGERRGGDGRERRGGEHVVGFARDVRDVDALPDRRDVRGERDAPVRGRAQRRARAGPQRGPSGAVGAGRGRRRPGRHNDVGDRAREQLREAHNGALRGGPGVARGGPAREEQAGGGVAHRDDGARVLGGHGEDGLRDVACDDGVARRERVQDFHACLDAAVPQPDQGANVDLQLQLYRARDVVGEHAYFHLHAAVAAIGGRHADRDDARARRLIPRPAHLERRHGDDGGHLLRRTRFGERREPLQPRVIDADEARLQQRLRVQRRPPGADKRGAEHALRRGARVPDRARRVDAEHRQPAARDAELLRQRRL